MENAASNPRATLGEWIESDPMRWRALQIAAEFDLPDWCLAAGFVRNLVWDKLNGYKEATPLQDVDLIYFDSGDRTEEKDIAIEKRLSAKLDLPWSVKNQARMHLRNGHAPYASTQDAMCYWPEVETAVGVRLNSREEDKEVLEFIAPLGLEALLHKTITYNPNGDYQAFRQRLTEKNWLKTWPQLSINCG